MKRGIVVDTNVPVVANRQSAQASPECVLACVQRLGRITNEAESLVLDDQYLIVTEYIHNLASSGQPGVGDAFLKWVLTNWANPQRCQLVRITPLNGQKVTFQEFPAVPDLAGFDPSDRKFVAVALAHGQQSPILQAVDSKWWEFRDALHCNGVQVDFLCEQDIQRLLS